MKALLSRLTGMVVAQGCQYTGTDAFIGYGCPAYLCNYPHYVYTGSCYQSGSYTLCRCYCC